MYVVMLDDGYSVGPFNSQDEAVEVDLVYLRAASIEPYRSRADFLLGAIRESANPSVEDWARVEAVKLVVEVDHIVFCFEVTSDKSASEVDLWNDWMAEHMTLHPTFPSS